MPYLDTRYLASFSLILTSIIYYNNYNSYFLALLINNLAYIRPILIKSKSRNRAKLGDLIYKFFI
jgi:hypothetical protein